MWASPPYIFRGVLSVGANGHIGLQKGGRFMAAGIDAETKPNKKQKQTNHIRSVCFILSIKLCRFICTLGFRDVLFHLFRINVKAGVARL